MCGDLSRELCQRFSNGPLFPAQKQRTGITLGRGQRRGTRQTPKRTHSLVSLAVPGQGHDVVVLQRSSHDCGARFVTPEL
eukprot:100967-Chlamydomonas_euryale.AAC.1